jgi:hypothetical protein
MEGAYLAELMSSLKFALDKHMIQPILKTKNNFLLAALLHPGVASFLISSKCVPSYVLDECWEGIASEVLLIAPPEDVETVRLFVCAALKAYRMLLPVGELPPIDIAALMEDGSYFGFSHMSFWKSVALGVHPKSQFLACLLPVASMLLAQPASEAVDEFAFSSAGRTLTIDQNSLAATTVEQITVI